MTGYSLPAALILTLAHGLWGDVNLLSAPPVVVGTEVRVEFPGIEAPLPARVVKVLPDGTLVVLGGSSRAGGYVLFSGEIARPDLRPGRVVDSARMANLAVVVRGSAGFEAASAPPGARVLTGPLVARERSR